MRNSRYLMLVLLLSAVSACAKKDENQDALPADTATMAPAPAPMPMDSGMRMDSAAHDTMQMSTTTK